MGTSTSRIDTTGSTMRFAGARLLEIIASSQNRLSDWLRDVPERPASPELRVACPDAIKTEVVARCAATYHSRGCSIVDIDGARVSFDGGWALVRASNTQPFTCVAS